MKKEFITVFQLNKKILFEVRYYTYGHNSFPHFSTSVYEFNQPKTDYKSAGQGQEELTKNFTAIREFWNKWDNKHLIDLTEQEYNNLMQDIKFLKKQFNYIFICLGKNTDPFYSGIDFVDMKKLSMMEPKKIKNKI